MWWKRTDRSDRTLDFPVDTNQPHYVIVWDEGEERRMYPISNHLSEAEDMFEKIIQDGLLVRGGNGMLEWVNFSVKHGAYIGEIAPQEPEE